MAAISITAANVLPSSQGQVFSGTAGATITQGQLLYLDTVTNTYKLANCLTNNPVAAMAVSAASNGQPFQLCSRDPNMNIGAVLTTGNILLAGNTGGAIQPYEDRTTGWYVTSIGVMITTTRLNFYITGSNAAI